ncbi:MAG TPA: alpha/beta fold hydrolase [Burkholderiales bacterium]|jgi:pimeloyl-ACP methyl ester carboxylesterase
MKSAAIVAFLFLSPMSIPQTAAQPAGQALATEEFMIPGADPGVQLYVRNKHPRGASRFSADNVVLFVHGATYPASTSFDLQLDGLSWMDYIAARGYDVYLVDLRGYGKSTRPPEMDQPAERNAPIVRTDTAARDYGAAVDFILKRRSVAKLNVLGWSWGTAITALYTSQNNAKVNRLVLYAPVWLRETKSLTDSGEKLGAYRMVTVEAALKRKATGIPEGKKPMPDAWADEWVRATFASDPVGAKGNPRFVRAPNGVIQDTREYWSAGKALYDPADLRVPTMLVLAEWDADTPRYMAQALFPKLVHADPKRLVIIGEGTHSVLMEKNRMQLFREVQLFLDERAPY